MSDTQHTDRRTFLGRTIYGLWSAIAAGLGLPAATYLLSPPKTTGGHDWVEAGDASRLIARVPEQWVFRRNRRDGWKVISEKLSAWMLKKPSGEIVAFAPQCTHLGCAYHWNSDKQQFICPCHSSTFSADGEVLSGPAPRPLDRYSVRIRDHKVFIGGRPGEDA